MHLDGNLRQLETEKEDLKNTVKTAGIERIKLSQTKDETEIDNGNLKAEVRNPFNKLSDLGRILKSFIHVASTLNLLNPPPPFTNNLFQLGSLSHKFDLLEQDRNRLSDLALELETTKNNLEECLQNLDREKGELRSYLVLWVAVLS